MKSDLAYATIQAPFSGLVSHRFREAGDLVLPGIPILEIESPEKGYRIFVRVPPEESRLHKGGLESHSFRGPEETFRFGVPGASGG
ncbi:MAG TPA: hypothetical protein EYP81_04840 [Thermodesulfobacteriaceae bacterium]|nr:hypothetical protein [Thermodesulfobacteriaceae bacterium]